MSMNNQCLNCAEYLKTISSIKENFNRKLQLINTDNQILKVQIEKFCKNTSDFSEPVNNVQLLKQHIEILLKTKDLLERENKKLKLEKSKAQDVCASCNGSIKKLINQVVDTEFYKNDSGELGMKGSMSNIESICKKFLNLEVCLRRQQEWSQDINEKYTNSQSLIEKLNKENSHLKFELETLKIELKESRNCSNADLYSNNQIKDTKSKNGKVKNSTKKQETLYSENPEKSIFYEKNRKKIQEIEKILLKIPKIPVEDELLIDTSPVSKFKSNIDTQFKRKPKKSNKEKEQLNLSGIENLVDISNRKSMISQNLSESSNSPVKEIKESKDNSDNSCYSLRSGKIIKTAANQNKKLNKIEERKFNLHSEDFNLSDSEDFDGDHQEHNSVSNDKAKSSEVESINKSISKLGNIKDEDLIKGRGEIVTQKPQTVDIDTFALEIDSVPIPTEIKEYEKTPSAKQDKENINTTYRSFNENEERNPELKTTNIDLSEQKTSDQYLNIDIRQSCTLNEEKFKNTSEKINKSNNEKLEENQKKSKKLKRKKSIITSKSSKKVKSNEFCNSSNDGDFENDFNTEMSNVLETEKFDLATLKPVEENNNFPMKINQTDNEIFQFNFSQHIQMPNCQFLKGLDIFNEEADNSIEHLPKSINENENNSIILSDNSITTQSIQSPINAPIELECVQKSIVHDSNDFSELSLLENHSHKLKSIDISTDKEANSINLSNKSPKKSQKIPLKSKSDESVKTENEKSTIISEQSKINVPTSEYNFQMLKSLNIIKDQSKRKSNKSLETRIKSFLGEIFLQNTPVELSMKKYNIAAGSEFVFDLFSRQFFAFYLNDLVTNRRTFTDFTPFLHQSALVISQMIGLCCEQNRALLIFHTRIIEDLLKLKITDFSLHLIRFILCVLFKLHSLQKQSHLSMTVIIDLLEHSNIPASIIISAIDSHFIDYSKLGFQSFQINILITFLKFLYHFEEWHNHNQVSTNPIEISPDGQRFWTGDRSDNPKCSLVRYLREQLIRNPDSLELINLLFSIAKIRCYK